MVGLEGYYQQTFKKPALLSLKSFFKMLEWKTL